MGFGSGYYLRTGTAKAITRTLVAARDSSHTDRTGQP